MVLKPEFRVSDGEIHDLVSAQRQAFEAEQEAEWWEHRQLEELVQTRPKDTSAPRGRTLPPTDGRGLVTAVFHERHDTVPCSRTWRRCVGTADDKVRIYLRFPATGDTITAKVSTDLRIGPPSTSPERPDYRRKLRGMKIFSRKSQVTSFTDFSGGSTSATAATRLTQTSSSKEEERDSLRDHIFRLTGLKPCDQRLLFNRETLVNDNSSLRDYGIGHGDSVLVIGVDDAGRKPEGYAWTPSSPQRSKSTRKEMSVSKASARKKGATAFSDIKSAASSPFSGSSPTVARNPPKRGFSFMPRWNSKPNPKILEADGVNMAPDSIFVFDYSSIRDVGHSDGASKIRKMHGI